VYIWGVGWHGRLPNLRPHALLAQPPPSPWASEPSSQQVDHASKLHAVAFPAYVGANPIYPSVTLTRRFLFLRFKL